MKACSKVIFLKYITIQRNQDESNNLKIFTIGIWLGGVWSCLENVNKPFIIFTHIINYYFIITQGNNTINISNKISL